jgi:hypothetical protein
LKTGKAGGKQKAPESGFRINGKRLQGCMDARFHLDASLIGADKMRHVP